MKNLAILALLSYISGTEALKLQYDGNDVKKDLADIKK